MAVKWVMMPNEGFMIWLSQRIVIYAKRGVEMNMVQMEGHKPYHAITIANKFLQLAEHEAYSLTNMQLQKLVFFSHGVYLGAFGRPLIVEEVKAWTFGPVIPQLYNKLRRYGGGTVTQFLENDYDDEVSRLDTDKLALSVIHLVWKTFGRFSGARLSAISHQPGSPWDLTWKREEFSVIPQSVIQDYYANQIKVNGVH